MRYETGFLQRCLRLAFAFSWGAMAPFQAFAGREIGSVAQKVPSFRTAPAASTAQSPAPPSSLLIAAANAPDLPAAADSVPTDAHPSTPSPDLMPRSPNVVLNLLNRMVQRGLLTKEDAADLIQQAEEDAATARAQAATVQAVVAQVAAVQAAPASPETDAASEDAVRVTYIPETVKAQLRDELRQEVMTQARQENWAAPRTFPDWVSRFKLFGDIRVRYEGIFFPAGNDNTGAFPNFNAINTGAPFDVSGTLFSPQLDVDQDRHRLRLRARLGVEADLGNGFTAGLRIATGENNSPVTTNQSLGLANQGQGGNFSKYAIWLDRAFLKYEAGGLPTKNLSLTLGRFDNPFFSTDAIWDEDVGFDGAALQAKYAVGAGVTPFLAAGVFPVFNTDLNFASNQPAKFKSSDKWLYGGQFGADWKINKSFNLKLGVAYYHFDNIEGQLSDPFIPLNAQDAGNTDNTRPSFAQKGNTYRPLRRIIPSPLNNFGTTNQFQYFGLATPFHEVALTGRFDVNHWEPFQISLTGEWVKNLAFDRDRIDLIAVNNRGADQSLGGSGRFSGGDTAWIVNLKVGSAALQKAWDWQAGINYRYVESDAVVDGFNDSDFGLGGTNLKGYTLYGAVALSPRIALGLRWMSSDEIAGPPLKIDILQVDFSGKF